MVVRVFIKNITRFSSTLLMMSNTLSVWCGGSWRRGTILLESRADQTVTFFWMQWSFWTSPETIILSVYPIWQPEIGCIREPIFMWSCIRYRWGPISHRRSLIAIRKQYPRWIVKFGKSPISIPNILAVELRLISNWHASLRVDVFGSSAMLCFAASITSVLTSFFA